MTRLTVDVVLSAEQADEVVRDAVTESGDIWSLMSGLFTAAEQVRLLDGLRILDLLKPWMEMSVDSYATAFEHLSPKEQRVETLKWVEGYFPKSLKGTPGAYSGYSPPTGPEFGLQIILRSIASWALQHDGTCTTQQEAYGAMLALVLELAEFATADWEWANKDWRAERVCAEGRCYAEWPPVIARRPPRNT